VVGALVAAIIVSNATHTPRTVSAGATGLSHSISHRSIAWVDFDVEPARAVFKRFSNRFELQPRGSRWALRFFGADVENPERLRAGMQQLLKEGPALIVATSVAVTQALQSLHAEVPVYFIIQSDPIRDGLVGSLRSTGNLTGYTFFVPLDVKAMEIIRRVFPTHPRVGIVADGFWLKGRNMSLDLFEQCHSLGIEVTLFQVESDQDIDLLPLDPRVGSIDVWYVPYSPIAFSHGTHIAQSLSGTDAVTVFARRKFLNDGAMLSIQAVDPDAMDVWAKAILDIMDGVPIGNIPVMRPKEIEVAANPATLTRLDPGMRLRIAREITNFESD
jgi:ABC-type uncharacterized transport system substrate-binding protein